MVVRGAIKLKVGVLIEKDDISLTVIKGYVHSGNHQKKNVVLGV